MDFDLRQCGYATLNEKGAACIIIETLDCLVEAVGTPKTSQEPPPTGHLRFGAP